jgi:PBSX family phage terminase large subunit
MELTPAQNKIVQDTHRFRVVVCGRKFGKTTLTSVELIGKAVAENNRRIMYIAPTLGDARRLMWDRLRNAFKAAITKENDTRLELRVKTVQGGESDIFLGSWELVNNYRGDEFDFIVFDEVQEYRDFWVGWQEAMRPTLTPRKGEALFTGTPKGFNHLYDLYNLSLTDNEYASFHFTTYDNPFIPIEEIESAKKLPEDRFAQEYLAEFRKSEGLVFREFKRELHLFNEDIKGYSEKLAGVDWGHRNPAAVPEILFKDNVYYVNSLLYKTGLTESDTADYVAAAKFNAVFPDPESSSGIEELKRRGVNVRQVTKGKDSIKHGIDKMRDLFLSNRLFIHTSCLDLIAELESYSYPEPRTFHNLNENPLDENNHAIDALRYVLSTHQPKRPLPIHQWHDKTIDIWRGTPSR